MPDLTIMYASTCQTNEQWGPKKVLSTDGTKTYEVSWGRMAHWADYQYGWSCSCQGFKFRKSCAHVKAVEEGNQRCGWNSCLEPTLDTETSPNGKQVCPECGGPVSVHQVGV